MRCLCEARESQSENKIPTGELLIPVSHHGGRRISRGWEMLPWGGCGRDRNHLPQVRGEQSHTRVWFRSVTKPPHYCSGWRTAPVLITSR